MFAITLCLEVLLFDENTEAVNFYTHGLEMKSGISSIIGYDKFDKGVSVVAM